jgi:putative toxin-antitoxin system antitoxin component (TIGR02293 family)
MTCGNIEGKEWTMENIAQIRSYLGGAKVIGSPKTELDFVPIIRKGFPVSVFTNLRDRSQLSEELICSSLRIAKRTAARRKKENTRLKPDESELLLRLARLFVAANNVLGNEDKARQWLTTENRSLDGAAPIQLLDTALGFEEAMNTLHHIEYGVFA